MNWVQHRFEGAVPAARHKHTCATLGTQIFVFGGMEAPPLGFNDIYILDTQPSDEKPGKSFNVPFAILDFWHQHEVWRVAGHI